VQHPDSVVADRGCLANLQSAGVLIVTRKRSQLYGVSTSLIIVIATAPVGWFGVFTHTISGAFTPQRVPDSWGAIAGYKLPMASRASCSAREGVGPGILNLVHSAARAHNLSICSLGHSHRVDARARGEGQPILWVDPVHVG
jgi:hypothetical protein